MKRVVIAAFLVGCGLEGGPNPESIDASKTVAQQAINVRIVGTGFEPDVVVDLNDESATIRNGFSAKLGETSLVNVEWVDATTLVAEVPPMPRGTYDLVVIDPQGRSGTLDDAFQVMGGPDEDFGFDATNSDGGYQPEMGGSRRCS